MKDLFRNNIEIIGSNVLEEEKDFPSDRRDDYKKIYEQTQMAIENFDDLVISLFEDIDPKSKSDTFMNAIGEAIVKQGR